MGALACVDRGVHRHVSPEALAGGPSARCATAIRLELSSIAYGWRAMHLVEKAARCSTLKRAHDGLRTQSPRDLAPSSQIARGHAPVGRTRAGQTACVAADAIYDADKIIAKLERPA